MHRTGGGVRFLVSTMVCASGVFGSGCKDASIPSDADDAVSNLGASTLVCGTSVDQSGKTQNDWFNLIAINNKFRHFPEFAAYANQTSARNCAEARTAVESYRQYGKAHPGFDAHEALEPDALPQASLAPPPTTRKADVFVAKMTYGTAAKDAAIVFLSNSGGDCTGSFIARNWIATAAHCLVTFPAVPNKYDAGRDKYGWDYVDYTISWSDADGIKVKTLTPVQVLQYADPRYPSNTVLGLYDFALLRVSSDNDKDIMSSPENGAALRLQASGDVLADDVFFGGGLPLHQMRSKAMADYSPLSTSGGLITAQGWSSADICHGDSGGPIVRDSTGAAPALVGVLVAYVGGYPCTSKGDPITWLNVEIPFIQSVVPKQSPYNECTVDPANAKLLKCWKSKQCKTDTDCAKTEFCSRGPSAFVGQKCSVCPTKGDCSCMKGTCETLPEFVGVDASAP